MASILIVDDEQNIRSYVVETMELDGHQVSEAVDGLEALERLRRQRFDLIISDYKMPRMDGMELAAKVQESYPNTSFIMMTAHGTIPSAVEAMKAGAVDYLVKPFKIKELREVTRRIIKAREAAFGQAPPPQSSYTLSWGASKMAPALTALERVAPTSASVMLLGESGVGKEIFAKTIHDRSPRHRKPFVAINCAAIAESLLESELFGHEKGAFTGANQRRIGAIEGADGGTVFLDEIGELKLESQSKLLRLIEQRTFQRLGSTQEITVDVRWITATNRDLREMVQAGRFRRDLYHRLATFPISIPPLRHRKRDIPHMAEALLDEIASRHQQQRPRLSKSALDWLSSQPWPGNVRELKNTLERALIITPKLELAAEDFSFVQRIEFFEDHSLESLSESSEEPISQLDEEPSIEQLEDEGGALHTLDLSALESQAIRLALEQAGDNKKEAAQILGIPLRTLYNKLKKLDG